MVYLKNTQALKAMLEGGRLLAQTLQLLQEHARPSITTAELNRLAHEFIVKNGAVPSFLQYNGFPASVCISVNEEIIHGIPGKRSLKEGDIVSVDVGVLWKGYHTDAARTFPVGSISPENAQLLSVCEQAFYAGLAKVLPGERSGGIGEAIEAFVAPYRYGIVREYTGHGVGESLHEDPPVPNYRGHRGIKLEKGMTLAIEPMLNRGGQAIRLLKNGWTVTTQDNSPSAHYENTVAVLEQPVVLTSLQAAL